ncbi:hypothetical protein RvY_11753, partial [Ramazzottius varieornatus]
MSEMSDLKCLCKSWLEQMLPHPHGSDAHPSALTEATSLCILIAFTPEWHALLCLPFRELRFLELLYPGVLYIAMLILFHVVGEYGRVFFGERE